MSVPERLRGLPPRALAAIAVGLVALAVALVLLVRGAGADASPPADAATRLVPADALVYVHVSTDRDRESTAEAERLARRFPGFDRALKGLAGRLSAPQCGVDASDVEGKEAGLALLDAGGGQAGSLVLVDTGRDQSKARERSCGSVQVVGVGDFLVIGQPQSLQRATDLAAGKGRALATDALYRAATDGLPAARVLDGWVTATGVQRLLAPQAGLLGAAGTLLDQPGLRGAAFGVTAEDEGARLTVTSMLDGKRRSGTFKPFTPSMAADVPDEALAYIGLAGLSTATTRLLGAADGGQLSALGPLLARARTALSKQSGGRLDEDLLALFRREVAVAISPAVPAPILTIIARTEDEAATRRTLARLQKPLAKILGPAGQPVPVWKELAGGTFQLTPVEGIEIDYAVFDGKLVLSTRAAGVDAVRAGGGRLADDDAYRAVHGEAPSEPVTSLVFLNLDQLLRLGEQTGLNDSKAYLAVKDDLQRVRAIGARSTSDGRQSTAELLLSIP